MPPARPSCGLAARLDEPLRVAIAGRVKAGKSTLLNALVGEPLAATDAGECTRLVTWYRNGTTYRACVQTRTASAGARPLRPQRRGGHVDLDGRPVDAVERLVIEWPAPVLATMTLIDTPGLGSLSTDISARTEDFLAPEGAQARPTPSCT